MKQLLVYIRDNKLKNDFENTIDAYIASCNDQGVEPSKPYGGKLIVHMPPDLHVIAAVVAVNAASYNL